MSLRPYQEQMDARRRASSARAILTQMPTGSGKSHLIERAAADFRSVMLLAHAEHLIDQLAALVPGQIIKAGVQYDGSPRIVGMVQTVVRRPEIPEPEAIILDEAHHAASGTVRKILERYPNARLFGYTATPARLDRQGLGDIFDELLIGPSYRELINAGYLKPFEVYGLPSDIDTASMRMRAGEFAAEDVANAFRRSTIWGDAVDHYRDICRGRGGHLSFWPSVEAARHAADRFRAAGITCVSIDGTMPREAIRAALDGLRNGTVDSIANCSLISEGLNVPGVASVSMCRPTASLSMYLQMGGRANRGGEGAALILDHVGNYTRHGLPDDDRTWSLHSGVRRREAADACPVWVCPECYRTNRSLTVACACGAAKPRHIVELEERAARLELITRAHTENIHDVCSTPEEYAEFAKLRGKRATWAALQWCKRPSGAERNVWLIASEGVRVSRREYMRVATDLFGIGRIAANEAANLMRLAA